MFTMTLTMTEEKIRELQRIICEFHALGRRPEDVVPAPSLSKGPGPQNVMDDKVDED